MPLCPPLCRRVSCLPLAVVSFSILLSPRLSNAETCPEAVSDRSKQGAWTCTFDLNSRAVHLMLLKGTEGHSQVFWFPEDKSGRKTALYLAFVKSPG